MRDYNAEKLHDLAIKDLKALAGKTKSGKLAKTLDSIIQDLDSSFRDYATHCREECGRAENELDEEKTEKLELIEAIDTYISTVGLECPHCHNLGIHALTCPIYKLRETIQ